jgi:hypothetical protein
MPKLDIYNPLFSQLNPKLLVLMMDPDMDLKRRHSIDNTVVLLIPPENTHHHINLNNLLLSN